MLGSLKFLDADETARKLKEERKARKDEKKRRKKVRVGCMRAAPPALYRGMRSDWLRSAGVVVICCCCVQRSA